MKRLIASIVLAGAGWALSAQRADAITFDFNSDNGGVGTLNWTGSPDWTVSGGTVDLIGNGFFDFLPGNGLYIDLDGSTGNAADSFSHTFTGLAAGTYVLSFDLAGNHRNDDSETVSVSFGSFANSYSLDQFAPFTTFSVLATVGANPTLTFGAAGGDYVGMLLDNVSVEPVPEPASLLLLGSGLTGLALRRRRRS